MGLEVFSKMNLSELYSLRRTFVVIGLTGRTCSGCSEVAEILSYDKSEFIERLPIPMPRSQAKTNDELKELITYNFVQAHWQKYEVIEYKDVLVLLLLEYKFDTLLSFIDSTLSDQNNLNLFLEPESSSFMEELREEFDHWSQKRLKGASKVKRLKDFKSEDELTLLYEIFYSQEFKKFSRKFHEVLKRRGPDFRVNILRTVANTIRRRGSLFGRKENEVHVYSIAEAINKLIKSFRDNSNRSNGEVHVVIDSLRNSLEILFFKERYSSYYTFAVNLDERLRLQQMQVRYAEQADKIKAIDNSEYRDKKGQFYEQDVSNCIQKADIHLNNTLLLEEGDVNVNQLYKNLAKFFALMHHPGLITPSPQERCMQIAYTAKYNSGCISRQVGAVVSDSNYSVKAVGWNNTPEGQTPCLLRDAGQLLEEQTQNVEKENELDNEYQVYSKYERTDKVFKKTFSELYGNLDDSNMKGLNCSFCFKSIQNSITEGKNQVHTRSLHAEENAFLQISKYGGNSVTGGILFSTASPCELCSKKAFQLGITKVFYIDPYPGIAKDQIMDVGRKGPKLILFNGAIGKAYHKLYEPFMAHKEEVSLRTGVNIKDKKSSLEEEIEDLNCELEKKESRIVELENEIENLSGK